MTKKYPKKEKATKLQPNKDKRVANAKKTLDEIMKTINPFIPKKQEKQVSSTGKWTADMGSSFNLEK